MDPGSAAGDGDLSRGIHGRLAGNNLGGGLRDGSIGGTDQGGSESE